MKYLAVCRPREDAAMDRFSALVPDEAADLRRLKSEGVLVEAWSPGGPGAVLIFDVASESDAAGILTRLPLSVAGLLDFELTPLHELGI